MIVNNIKLKINGKELNYSFGLGLMGELVEEYGTLDEVIRLTNTNGYKYIPQYMYESAKHQSYLDGKEFKLKLHQFLSDLNNHGFDTFEFKRWTELFQISLFGHGIEEDEEEQNDEDPKN